MKPVAGDGVVSARRVFRRLRRSAVWRGLFGSAPRTLLTLVALFLLWQILPPLVDWAVLSAVWSGDSAECRSAAGACWAFVEQKHRFILFGLFPYEEQWRPLLAMIALVAMLAASCDRRFWRWWIALLWLATLVLFGILMWGGVFGLPRVETERWGGLPLTLVLAVFGIAFAFPLAIILALGRQAEMPVIRALSIGYIEIIRGVPLVSILFMASVMFPLFLPEGVTVNKLLRAQVGIILFTAAYLAEAIRGGLQAVPRGQYEAADALALGYWQKTGLVILPQALRLVIPPVVNQFISCFKDTSLVVIIGLFDLLTAAKVALADPSWRPFYVESYVFAAVIYFTFCYFMSRYSQFLERSLGTGAQR